MILNCFGIQYKLVCYAVALFFAATMPAALFAQPSANEAAMEKRIQDLENRIAVLEQLLISTAAGQSAPSVGPSRPSGSIGLASSAPIAPTEGNIIERIRTKIFEAEIAETMPWLQPEVWSGIREGMTEAEVEAILGKPTRKLESLKLRVDMVWFYNGTNRATGQAVEGKINFLRGKVKSIEAPQL